MAVLKEVRVRPRFASVDERLGEVTPNTSVSNTSTSGTSGTSGVSDLAPSNMKGALSDAKIVVSVNDDKTEYSVDFLPVGDPKGTLNFKKTTKADKPITEDSLISEMMTTAAQKKLSATKGIDVRATPENYYKIVQDPWQDTPAKVRNFGFDKYYLNNGAEINIAWIINGKEANLWLSGYDSKTKEPIYKNIDGNSPEKGNWLGGEIWSTNGGIEIETSDKTIGSAHWLNPDTSKIEVYPETLIKKYVLVKYKDPKSQKEEYFTTKDATILEFERRPKPGSSTDAGTGTSGTSGSSTTGTSGTSASTSGTSGTSASTSGTSGTSASTSGTSGTSASTSGTSGTSASTSGTSGTSGISVTSGTSGSSNPAFSVKLPTTWSPAIEKINSDKSLITAIIDVWKKSTPNYEKLALCEPDFYPTVELEYVSPFANDPNDPVNQEALANNEKYQLNVKLPDLLDVKTRVDMPMFSVYIGDIPAIDPDNIFTDEIEQYLQDGDDEFTEAAFVGEGENIHTIEERAEIEAEQASIAAQLPNGGQQLTVPQGSYSATGLEPDTPWEASKLKVPPGFNGVPLHTQCDPRFNKYAYGKGNKTVCTDGSTICSSGCMPSSLSMMINYWAKKGYAKSFVTPSIVGQFVLDYGGRVCGAGGTLLGINKAKFKETFGLNIEAFSNIGDDKVELLLKKGYPINHAGSTTGLCGDGSTKKSYGAHYLCMTGIDEQGRIRVNDSGNNPIQESGLKQILKRLLKVFYGLML